MDEDSRPSPGQPEDEGASSSSGVPTTEPVFRSASLGRGPAYGLTGRLESRQHSRTTTPGTSGRPTPIPLEELSFLRQGQVDAAANMERMQAQQQAFMENVERRQNLANQVLESRLNLLAQQLQAPVSQALHNSTAAAQLASENAGAHAAMQEDLLRVYQAAYQANQAMEANIAAVQRQSELSRQDLARAAAAMDQSSRGGNSSTSTTTAERLAAQLEDMSTTEPA
jgi:hypothetical protein